jgi:hypothetical protein
MLSYTQQNLLPFLKKKDLTLTLASYFMMKLPESLVPALNGVTGMHLITLSSEGYGPLQTGPDIVELAIKAGVRRVTVLWSGVNGPVEQAVESSSLVSISLSSPKSKRANV